jgi:hypothetical protein
LPEARDQLVQQIRSERANALRRAYIGELLKDHPPHGDRDWGDRRRTFNSQAAPVPAAGSASSISAAFSSNTARILASRRFRSPAGDPQLADRPAFKFSGSSVAVRLLRPPRDESG